MLNRYDPVLARRMRLGAPGDLALSLDLELLGTIPESPEVSSLQLQGKTMADGRDARLRAALEQAVDSALGISSAPAAPPRMTWYERLRALLGD